LADLLTVNARTGAVKIPLAEAKGRRVRLWGVITTAAKLQNLKQHHVAKGNASIEKALSLITKTVDGNDLNHQWVKKDVSQPVTFRV